MGLCFRLTVMQWQIPNQTEFVEVHRHLFFVRRMLRLKAFPWQSVTTTQLLVRSRQSGRIVHCTNGTLADGGSLHREDLHPQTHHEEKGGLA